MSTASVEVDYEDEGGSATMRATYSGTADVLMLSDGREQSMAIGYEAARALVEAIDRLREARAELR